MHKTPETLHESPDSVKILGGCFHQAAIGQDFPSHSHACWELVCYVSGEIDAPVGDVPYRTEPGMFLLTPPHTAHSERARTAYSNVCVNLEAPGIEEWPRVGFDDANRSITETCAQIIGEWRSGGAESDAMIGHLVARLGILMRRCAKARETNGRDPLLDCAEQIMEQRYASPITIDQVAREVGCAPSTLRERFLRHRSRAPHEHLVDIRLRHAKSLLRHSTAPLEAIAMMTGFYSSSHLSRAVRKATGQSPGAYRAAGR